MGMRVYCGPTLGSYGFPDGHPFGPDRLDAFVRELKTNGLDRRVELASPVPCTREELLRFHEISYVERVERQSATGEGFLDYGDTPAFPGVFEAALTVVGSVLDAASAILQRSCECAFVPIAGLHHARRDGAAGFCVFNDIGVLIEWLRAEHGVKRVAYIDIDAHHGDGVYYGFEEDPDLIFADIHEDGRFLYPGTGAAYETGLGVAKGTKVNIPVPPGANDELFHRVWPEIETFVRAARPEFVLLQAGADSVAGDPLTHMHFSPAVHGYAAGRLRALAAEMCEGRFIATGGGGYNRANLAAAWCQVVEAMLPGNDVVR
ncbi:MAG: acetoin utilization protein AcuC [Sulfurifustaceae bacterium]